MINTYYQYTEVSREREEMQQIRKETEETNPFGKPRRGSSTTRYENLFTKQKPERFLRSSASPYITPRPLPSTRDTGIRRLSNVPDPFGGGWYEPPAVGPGIPVHADESSYQANAMLSKHNVLHDRSVNESGFRKWSRKKYPAWNTFGKRLPPKYPIRSVAGLMKRNNALALIVFVKWFRKPKARPVNIRCAEW